ncbi:hypothetical protein ACK3TF_000971 [Chlorella vulgaris]
MWAGCKRSARPNGWRDLLDFACAHVSQSNWANILPSDLRCVQFVDDMHPPVYRPINWGQFRSKRYEGAWGWERVAVAASRSLLLLLGDYADKGEEVQISHYRLDRIGSKEQRQQQQQVAT